MNLLCRLFTASCPNCDSAWTGGCVDPENRTSCIVCSNRKGEITGWVWNRLVDPFLWYSNWIVHRNLKRIEREGNETSKSK